MIFQIFCFDAIIQVKVEGDNTCQGGQSGTRGFLVSQKSESLPESGRMDHIRKDEYAKPTVFIFALKIK